MDKANELSKSLRGIKDNIQSSLHRIIAPTPKIERARDIFDNVIPFELIFNTSSFNSNVSLDLFFHLPPGDEASCCADCFCGICEFFIGSDPILVLTYPYFQNSVAIYRDEVKTTNFSFTDTTTITLGFTPSSTEAIKVCYVYQINGCIPAGS